MPIDEPVLLLCVLDNQKKIRPEPERRGDWRRLMKGKGKEESWTRDSEHDARLRSKGNLQLRLGKSALPAYQKGTKRGQIEKRKFTGRTKEGRKQEARSGKSAHVRNQEDLQLQIDEPLLLLCLLVY
jgi:hypothetical protein